MKTLASAIVEVERIAQITANRMVIHYDPVAFLYRVTIGPYQAESSALLTALNQLIQQRIAAVTKAPAQ